MNGQRWRAPAAVAAIEGLSLVVGLLLQPLLMRALGPTSYGAYLLAVAAGSAACTLVDTGSNYTGVQRMLDASTNPVTQRDCYWLVQQAKLCSAGLVLMLAFSVSALAVGFGALAWNVAAVVCMSVSLGALTAFCVPTWLLYALNKPLRSASGLLIARAAAIPTTLLLVRGPEDLGWAVACTAGTPALAAAFALLEPAFRTVLRHPQRFPSREILAYMRHAAPAIGVPLLPMLSGMLLPALIGTFGSLQTAGLFGAADKLRTGVVGLSTAFANAAFPMAVSLLAKGDHNHLGAAVRLVAVQPVVAALVAVPLALWPEPIMQFVAGDAYEAASTTLAVLAAAIVSSTLVGAVGVNFLIAAGAARAHLLAASGGLAALTLLLAVWVPRHGAPGAAWAVLAADGVVLMLQIWQLRRLGAQGSRSA